MQTKGLSVLLCVIVMTSRVVDGVSCVISNFTSGLNVDCKNSRITSFLKTWPSPVVMLDLSINNLTDVRRLTQPCFSELRHLDLSRNLLHFVPSDTLQHLKKLEWLDLSYNNLGVIPSCAFHGLDHLEFLALCHTGLVNLTQDIFRELPKLLTLDLSGNNMTEIPKSAIQVIPLLQSLKLSYNNFTVVKNMTFATLSTLEYLDLKGNVLVTLERDAFVGPDQLIDLDLSYNRLIMNQITYPAGVFRSLTALQNLRIHGNDQRPNGQYPENVFTPLTSVRRLSIDTFQDTHFGSAFSTLTNLTSLDLTNKCKISRLTNRTFEAFHNSSLQSIHLRKCKIVTYDKCVFCFLPRLQTLELERSFVGDVTSALGVLYGLQSHNMSTINFNHCCEQSSGIGDLSFQFLSNICVDSLLLSNCKVTFLTPSSLEMLYGGRLATCLKGLDFSQNHVSDTRTGVYIYRNMFRFSKLESLHIQNQKVHDYGECACFHTSENACQRDLPSVSAYEIDLHLRLPQSLQYLDISGITKTGILPSIVNFMSSENLTFLGMSSCGINRCNSTINGVTALETFDLSKNYCKELSVNILQNMASLRILNMSYLSLDQDFMDSHGHDLLGHLQLLENLDLSNNGLERLPLNMLEGQRRLVKLLLNGNRFQSVPVNISLHPGLQLLDLSDNIITTLSRHDRNVFDNLAAKHAFHLRMRKNLFSCSCENLDFVQWLATTEVRLDGDHVNDAYDDDYDDNGRSYLCMTEDGTVTSTSAVIKDGVHQWQHCAGESTFWVALSGLFLVFLTLFTAFQLARNWTHVRYMIYSVSKVPLPRRRDFRKDAFIVYTDEDEDLVVTMDDSLRKRHGVRLLWRRAKERSWRNTAEELIQGIDDSWKVVILVTPKMIHDDWAIFNILQAQRSIKDTMPDRVIVVFAEDPVHVPHMMSLQHLLRMVPEGNVFYIPRGTPSNNPRWDRLAEAILFDKI